MLFVLFLESFCMFLYDFLYVVQFMFGKATVFSQFNSWLQPKFSLITITHYMYMHSLFLVGENFEDIATFSTKNRTHCEYFGKNKHYL